MSSYEHLLVYKNIIKDYLKKKGITDFSKFKVALTHDKPHFLKWEYDTNIVKPKIEYLEKEFKIDLSGPRRKLHLEIAFIYIDNSEIFKNAMRPSGGGIDSVKLKQPIYFNKNGDIVDPSLLDMVSPLPKDLESVKLFENNACIESILKIDIETTPTIWNTDTNHIFVKRLSIDNGLLKYIIDTSPHDFTTEYPESVMVRVLVAYQKKPIKPRSSEILKTVSAVYPLSNDALKSLNN